MEAIELAELARVFTVTGIGLRVPDQGYLAGDNALAGRWRGAWGREMMGYACQDVLDERPCTEDPICDLDVFFGDWREAETGRQRPKPYALCVSALDNDLLMQATLFGWPQHRAFDIAADLDQATIRTDVAGTALNRAADVVVRRMQPRGDLPDHGPVILRLLSPMALRSGRQIAGSVPGFFSSLCKRVRGLASWDDLRVQADWPALTAASEALTVMEHSLRQVSWHRGSLRQDTSIPMQGVIGDMVIDGDLSALRPLLAIGELIQAGSRTTHGLGRFEIIAP